jgi:hypothetical protein
MVGKVWVVCMFQNSKGYFTTGWIAFPVDNELKVDNKLLFTITSPFNIIVKVFWMEKVVLSVDYKVDEDDYDNDIEEEDITNDEDYKEKDKDEDDKNDVDDDDDKVVRLVSNNEEHSYQTNDKLPKSQTPWLHQHINCESISKLDGCNQICEFQYKCHSNQLSKL